MNSTPDRGYDLQVVDREDVRRTALSLPGVTEDPHGFRFSVDGRAFVWSWLQRIEPKRARIPNPDVIAVRVANELDKATLIEMDPDVFFTEAHYDGYPAVLVRLPAIDPDLLRVILTDGWRCRAPRRLLRESTGGGVRSTD